MRELLYTVIGFKMSTVTQVPKYLILFDIGNFSSKMFHPF